MTFSCKPDSRSDPLCEGPSHRGRAYSGDIGGRNGAVDSGGSVHTNLKAAASAAFRSVDSGTTSTPEGERKDARAISAC